ncbi:hypothetical protein QYY82_06630, partial [Xanthomonas campestris pv. campestris]|nr:hypothetical protein [Xanthomonas campestris pv. campestris]
NNLNVAVMLSANPSFEVIVAGGVVPCCRVAVAAQMTSETADERPTTHRHQAVPDPLLGACQTPLAPVAPCWRQVTSPALNLFTSPQAASACA